MSNFLLKNAVSRHWRATLMATASVGLSACVATDTTSSSAVSSSSESVVSSSVTSSVAVESSSSVAPVISSSSEPVVSSSSEAPSSSSAPVISSSSVMSSSSVPSQGDESYTIEKIGCTEPDDYSGEATTFFDGSGGFANGFFAKNYGSSEYDNLSGLSTEADYNLGNNRVSPDPSCDNRSIHTGTWLKKLRDTDGQHSNGFNTGLNRSVGEIESIVIELKINSNKTDVPSVSELEALYGATLADQGGIDNLDNGKVAFGLTLNNPDANDDSVRGEVYFEVDQDLYADQWVRVTIPKDNLYFWTGAPWEKNAVDIATANATNAASIYLNPETKGNGPAETYGSVVRNIYGYDAWTTLDNKPAEDFKEMNISIRTFEVRYDESGSDGQQSSSSAGQSSSVGTSSSSAPSSGGQGCGGALYCEDFSGGQLPSWLGFADCNNGNSSANITGGALEVTAGSSCGGWAKLTPIDDMSSAYVKFDVTSVAASGNHWFVLIGNGSATEMSVSAMRLRPANFAGGALQNSLTWNVGDNGDAYTPNFFQPGGAETTAPFNSGDTACFEIFYDNSAEIIRLWKDGELLSGLELTGSTATNSFQDAWYSNGFTPDVKHIHLGAAQGGVKMKFDNVVISQSPIGCN